MPEFYYYTAQQLPKQEPKVFNAEWTDITPELKAILLNHFLNRTPPILLGIDAHIEMDSFGSSTELGK